SERSGFSFKSPSPKAQLKARLTQMTALRRLFFHFGWASSQWVTWYGLTSAAGSVPMPSQLQNEVRNDVYQWNVRSSCWLFDQTRNRSQTCAAVISWFFGSPAGPSAIRRWNASRIAFGAFQRPVSSLFLGVGAPFGCFPRGRCRPSIFTNQASRDARYQGPSGSRIGEPPA